MFGVSVKPPVRSLAHERTTYILTALPKREEASTGIKNEIV